MKFLALFFCLLLFAGCAARRRSAPGLAYLIAPSCLTAAVELAGCDENSPPKCKQSIIRFRKGCETIDVKNNDLKPKENSK